MKTLDKEILRLAAPAIINNITVPLLGLSDTAIAGHLGDARYIGAMSVGAMMLNVVFWLAGFLRMGTTGLTAQSLGSGDKDGCREVLRKSLKLALGISLIVLVFQRPMLHLLLRLIAPEPEIAASASLYFNILVWGVPAQLTIMAVSGWFIGLQTTTVPMAIAIAVNLVNIALSLLLVFAFRLGFEGIAIGTLAANWLGAAGAVILARRRFRRLELNVSTGKRDGIRWRDLFSVNGNLFIRSACIMAVTLTVTSVGARLGSMTLAANAIIMQFFIFFSYFMDGFAFSGEALAGRYSGAGEGRMVVRVMKRLAVWGAVMAVFFFSIYYFGTEGIARLLTDEEDVVRNVMKYRVWILLLPPVTVTAFIFDGIFVGLTRTRAMMAVTLVGAGAFFGAIYFAGDNLDNNVLWIAFELYLFLRGALLAGDFVLIKRKTLNL